MGKILSQYKDYTASQIISKASNTCTYTNLGTTVDCTNIMMSKIKNVLGSSSSSLGGLCTSANVNKYSNFSPLGWYITNYNLVSSPKQPYKMSYFCGYNHNALPPTVTTYQDYRTIVANTEGVITLTAQFNLGEYDYTKIDNISKIGYECSIDGVVKATSYYPLTNLHGNEVENTFNVNYSVDKIIVNTLFFADSNNVKICYVPEITNFNTLLNVSQYPVINLIFLDDSFMANYPDARLHTTYTYINISGVYQINFSDIIEDGNIITANLNLYARKNNGNWVSCGKTLPFSENSFIISGNLPFAVTYDDVVDFNVNY